MKWPFMRKSEVYRYPSMEFIYDFQLDENKVWDTLISSFRGFRKSLLFSVEEERI